MPELNATAMVNRIKALIERGFSWRSISYRTVKDIEARGAQGIELILSGKLAGKGGRKRSQRIAVGYMKKVGDQVKLVDYAKAAAYPKPGAIGIKLRIVLPETIFPDKVDFREIIKQRKEAQEKAAVQEQPVAEGALQAAEPEKTTAPSEENPAESKTVQDKTGAIIVEKQDKNLEAKEMAKEQAAEEKKHLEKGKAKHWQKDSGEKKPSKKHGKTEKMAQEKDSEKHVESAAKGKEK